MIHNPEEVVAYANNLSLELGLPVEPGFVTIVLRVAIKGSDEHELTYIRLDCSRFSVFLTTSVIRTVNGEITGYIGVAVDISDRKRADEAMRAAQLHLEERVQLRTEELAKTNERLEEETNTVLSLRHKYGAWRTTIY